MAKMTMRLVVDQATKRYELVLDLQSDRDAMPHEHEDHHRQLVNGVAGGAAAVSRDETPTARTQAPGGSAAAATPIESRN